MGLTKMFGKLGSLLSTGLEYAESKVGSALSSRYPDLDAVMTVMNKIEDRVKNDDVRDSADPETDDQKWRPALLTVALLIKLQKLREHMNDPSANIMSDMENQEKLLQVFGAYWHMCTRIGKALRSFESDSEEESSVVSQDSDGLVDHLVSELGIPKEDVLVAHSTDSAHLKEGHCPDFAVVLMHHHQQVLINVCGTRMIPQPKMSDVFMDLAADAVPFRDGKAHQGMAVGAQNILAKCSEPLSKALSDHPDYGVLVTGYSLGAGIAPLLTMTLMSGEVDLGGGTPQIRCITYGAPPVFQLASGDKQRIPNIINVVNHNDGLASASLNTVTKFFEQIKAVDDLQLQRREMFKMLMEKVPTQGGQEIHDDDDDDDDDADSVINELPEKWQIIQNALESVEKEDSMGMARLDHPAGKVFNFKKKSSGEESRIVTRVFKDTTAMTNCLQLRGSMLNHHMPWGYDGLFQNYGTDVSQVPNDVFQEVLALSDDN